MRDRRVAAAQRAVERGLPSVDEEVWRYSRIGELDLDAFTPMVPRGQAPAGLPTPVGELLAQLESRAGYVVLCNGRVMERWLDPALEAKGVELGPVLAAEDAESLLGSVAGAAPDVFAELNLAFCSEPLLLRIPDGVVVDEPIGIFHWTDAEGAATFDRLMVQAGEGSAVRIVEAELSADVRGLAAPLVELAAASGSQIGYLAVQATGDRMWRIGSQVSSVGADARFVSGHAAFGGSYARARTDCRMEGQGSAADLHALYFGAVDQMLDFRIFQEHLAPDTTSDLLFKGAVRDTSRGVYTGLIHVGPDAKGTDAHQTNRNVKLGPGAWAESVPNLEIENNEVRCSHASTVGPVDAEQLFYLESRGVPTHAAERLIVTGFFDEVLDRLVVPALRPELRSWIAGRLEERET